MPKQPLLSLLFLMAVLSGSFLARSFCGLPKPGVTQANYERLRQGMTRDAVEHLLGPPQAGATTLRRVEGMDREGAYWPGVELDIVVTFDDRGELAARECYTPGSESRQTITGRVRRFLRRCCPLQPL